MKYKAIKQLLVTVLLIVMLLNQACSGNESTNAKEKITTPGEQNNAPSYASPNDTSSILPSTSLPDTTTGKMDTLRR
jgi:hypothetical protein